MYQMGGKVGWHGAQYLPGPAPLPALHQRAPKHALTHSPTPVSGDGAERPRRRPVDLDLCVDLTLSSLWRGRRIMKSSTKGVNQGEGEGAAAAAAVGGGESHHTRDCDREGHYLYTVGR